MSPQAPAEASDNVADCRSDMIEQRVPDFAFPGTPYPQQTALMSALYNAMDKSAFGLFESPTGTGKTLSIICAISAFLRRPITPPPPDADWVEAFAAQQAYDEASRAAEAKAARRRGRVARVRSGNVKAQRQNKRRRSASVAVEDDDKFLVGEHAAEQEVNDSESDEEKSSKGNGTATVDREKQKPRPLRVLFATRTHSQLTQFVDEYRKTSHSDTLSVVVFGSRKQLCVNPSVRGLTSATAISDRCRELNEASSKKKRGGSACGCPHRDKEDEELLADRILTKALTVNDMEDAARSGGGCAYFGVRKAVASGDADVIGVPYSAVLHPPTAAAVGLNVDDDTIVVFDEAHNIVDAVCELNSSILSFDHAAVVLFALNSYLERYQNRLSNSNLFSIRQLVTVAKAFIEVGKLVRRENCSRVLSPSKLIFDSNIDNVNLFNLVQFLRESRLFNKLRGFVQHQQATTEQDVQRNGTADGPARTPAAALAPFESFLASLAECASYSRVALYPNDVGRCKVSGGAMRYFVLDPAALFKQAVGNARAVLMLGGTLSPRDAIKQRLLRGLERTVVEFECEHVVPASHVRTLVVPSGPNGHTLELTHRSKNKHETLDDLGKVVAALSRNVPGGVVLFFTSYEFLELARLRWARTNVLDQVDKVKFYESRGDSSAFDSFTRAIDQGVRNGALLGAVMGGRLSEGINFSDDLGRLVVVVGMPFANARDVECAEMLKALPDSRQRSQSLLNSCMTVVNQSVGRAVRHRADYATVALVDNRYARPQTQALLPSFVRRNISITTTLPDAHREIERFFSFHHK